MKRAMYVGMLGLVVILAGAGCANKSMSGSVSATPSASFYEERPFVEGEQAPLPPCGFAWCLEKRSAVHRQVTEQVVVRPATSYYETIPAQYASQTEKILVAPEQQHTVLVRPAIYRDVPKQRLVDPSTVEYKTVPAEYRWVNEEVEVVPERTEKIFIPARYEEYQERMLIMPERKVRVEVPGCDKDGGQVNCYATRTIPAEYTTVTKKRLAAPATTQLRVIPPQKKILRASKVVSPARVEKVEIPAQYQTVMTKELERPAEYRTEIIPAQYTTVEKKVVAVPESQRLVEVPAKYGTVCRSELVSPERLVWVLKKTNTASCPVPPQ